MRWEDERYVRLYTRDTPDWLMLSFEAQGLLALIMRKLDRVGFLELGRHGKKAAAIAIGHVHRWDTIGPALEELLADGCLAIQDGKLFMGNFMEAQEARQSDRQRQAESRARARDMAKVSNVTIRDDVSQNVTKSHTLSQPVTLAVPYLAVPSEPATTLHALAEASGAAGEQLPFFEPVKNPEAKPPGEPTPNAPSIGYAAGSRKSQQQKQSKPQKQADPRHASVRQMLCRVFEEVRKRQYGFQGGQDARAITRLLAFTPDDAEIERRWRAALAVTSRWDCVHSIAVFASRWNAPTSAETNPVAQRDWRKGRVGAEEINPKSFEVTGDITAQFAK